MGHTRGRTVSRKSSRRVQNDIEQHSLHRHYDTRGRSAGRLDGDMSNARVEVTICGALS